MEDVKSFLRLKAFLPICGKREKEERGGNRREVVQGVGRGESGEDRKE